MAEQDQEQKTEDPTEKRLEKAREEGRIAKSPDLAFAIMLLVAAGASVLFGGDVLAAFRATLFECTAAFASSDARDGILLGQATMQRALVTVAPFLLCIAPTAAAIGLAQAGGHFLPQRLAPRPERLLPNLAPSRFVNAKSLIETLVSLMKLGVLCLAGWLAIGDDLARVLAPKPATVQLALAGELFESLLVHLGFGLLAIGALDYVMKRKNLMKELRMTKQEVKQEAKDAQGDPEVKGKIKRRQRQLAMQRMMEEVPKASVVIANPTHFAVALRYESGMGAPRAVAKGVDLVAQRIKELARLHRVPIVENPPLARALHAAVQPGDEIPAHLYQAVAEVLAAVYRAEKRAARRRG